MTERERLVKRMQQLNANKTPFAFSRWRMIKCKKKLERVLASLSKETDGEEKRTTPNRDGSRGWLSFQAGSG